MNAVQALANSSQRRNLLQELFADIALEVDDRAKGKFAIKINALFNLKSFVLLLLWVLWLIIEYGDSRGNMCFEHAIGVKMFVVCPACLHFSRFIYREKKKKNLDAVLYVFGTVLQLELEFHLGNLRNNCLH